MKFLVDEMPNMATDCPFFAYCDCKLSGNLCSIWIKEQYINIDAECEHLKVFKPFVFDNKIKTLFDDCNKILEE